MKKLIGLTLAMVVSAFSLYAQQKGNSLLWEVSGNGLEQSSYVYGTFHLLCPDDLSLSKKVKTAIDESEQLVLELDFDDPNMMQTLQQSMVYRDGTTAKDYLNEDDYKLLAGFFKDSLNMPFQRLQGIKPFFLSSMTLQHFLGCRPASFEQRLTKAAKSKNMEVKGLETVEEQLGFIENLSMELKTKMLMENLKEYEKSKKMFNRMIGYYRNENLNGLNSITEEYMSEEYAHLKQDLLIKRNQRWVPRIRELAKKKASFIAVGASHLPGKHGILQLLRDSGYTVQPVR